MLFFLTTALTLFFSTDLRASGPEYCAAIRGNGENVAAHWAALSRMVEENGMPQAMAGGSSATVSMFFLDSIAGNPVVKNEPDAELKRKKEGLLVKSLGEFITEMAKVEQAVSAYSFMAELTKGNSAAAARLERILSKQEKLSNENIERALAKYIPLLNPELVRGLLARPDFFVPEVKYAISVFGKFDAVSNNNLFVRPGLVDFKEFALNLGNIADFYRGSTDSRTKIDLATFVNSCAEKMYQKQWSEADADCVARFQRMVAAYMRAGDFQNKAIFAPIGENIESIPTTSLIIGQAVTRFQDFYRSYNAGDAKRDYAGFAVNFENEVQYGYWTNKGKQIKESLAPLAEKGDLKSKKFRALSPNNWFEVLATSPAEPGLASIQPIPVNTNRDQVLAERAKPVAERWKNLSYATEALSAGGWSDLHPTAVLKAAGCERVAYFTRKDGETIFGQQVFIRLTGAQEEVPFWQTIKEQNNTGWNVSGSTKSSSWNRLYNAGNAESSFNRALQIADITFCTDWNRFAPFKGEMRAMEKDSYAAPVFLRAGVPPSFQVNPMPLNATASAYPGCIAR